MSDLPKNCTPGPWPEDYVYEAVRHIARNCDFIESQTDPEFSWDRYEDAPAIQALPDWIARCESVEAERDHLRKVIKEAKSYLQPFLDDDDLARQVFIALSTEE